MRRWGLIFLICLCAVQRANAEDAVLKSLSAKLIAIRGTHGINTQRDAGPELTPIKGDLRLWVEAQLPALGEHGDVNKLAKRLTEMLRQAGLTCESSGARCDERQSGVPTDEDARGYLSGVSISYLNYDRYIAVQTNVGVRCGFDSSAYVYEWHDKGWRFVFQSEQDRYAENEYAPQNFFYVLASSEIGPGKEKAAPPLVLTVGYSPWCQSNWLSLYLRLWRISTQTVTPKPFAEEARTFFFDDNSVDAILMPDEALVQYEGDNIDGENLVRTHVFHYVVHGNRADRIAPVAFKPDDFIGEWLTRPWEESANWIDASADRSSLHNWYGKFHKGELVLGALGGDGPRRCESDATLWQVEFTQDAGPNNPEVSGYFLVRWLAPYRFTLMDIRKEKSRNCDIADPMRNNVGTLFPFH